MTPFRTLYGYDSLTFMDVALGDSMAPMAKDWVQESWEILRELKDHLQKAQNQQKIYADKNKVERNFEVGDLVYLRLQPYHQTSIKKNGVEKLKPRFYGPYKVSRRIGEVAYEIELPSRSKIHNVFHVSCLKKALGQQVIVTEEIPPLDEEGQLILIPEEVLEVREKRLRNMSIEEYLIKWKNLPIEDASWEGEQVLQCMDSELLVGKQF